MKRKYKYLSMLVAYKDIDEDVKEMITKYSVYHIEKGADLDILKAPVVTTGQSVGLNERLKIYLERFHDSIIEKIKEGYMLDIIEIHKSYDISRKRMLEEFDIQYGDAILVMDEIAV